MYEQEKQKATHLIILLYNTILIIALMVGTVYFSADIWTSILFLIAMIASWILHVTEKVSESIRSWMYIILSLLIFYYYGIHELSLFDLTAFMLTLIFICTIMEKRAFIRLCAITYYPTMCFKILILYDNILELPLNTVARIVYHFLLLLTGAYMADRVLLRRMAERKKAGERISQLEEANRSVEDFLANVSHELRTPINAVTGITTVMLKNEDDSEKRKDILSVQMAGNRLFGQIEDILDYSEIDTGRVIVSEDNYMIFSLINDLIVENRSNKWGGGLELIFDVDAGIPSILLGDARKIKKIIKHLVDNAVKFTKKGGVYVRVYALKKRYGINLCIKVSDTGIGIAEEELERITDKFFQANGGRNRKVGGLGLGLSIVHGMVSAMDGFMRIESAEGSGTTVSVSIPQKVVDKTPSMEVKNGSDLCIALYLKPEKYEVPEIRDYYNATITHLVQGLDLVVHRVFEPEEMKKLVGMYRLTHLVIGKEEYEENATYFEGLDEGIELIVVADSDFLPENSRGLLLQKPFYCLPIVNILNAQTVVDVDELERNGYMTCPGVRVLVVDDEPMNLMVAEGIFKDYQMTVTTAGGGMEAIELCSREEFDLIFLDHMMPEMDGVETIKRLRKIQADAGKVYTIIAFTANAVSGAREMFLQEGFDEFISKPIEDQELKRLLKKVLPKTSIVFTEKNEINHSAVKEQGKSSDKAEAEQTATSQDGGQEPVSGDKPESDKITRLGEIGLNTGAGLQYCRDDREFYENVTLKFASDAERKMTDIETAFEKEDIKNYQIMVHALKSSSKMIGGDKLSEMAKKSEDAAKDQDVTYIRENHAALMDKYRETVQNILDVLSPAGENAAESEEASVSGTEVSGEELVKHLAQLKESLDTYEADKAEELLAEMNGLIYRGTSVSALLRDVRQDVEDFEMGAAAEKVAALIDGMEGGEA